MNRRDFLKGSLAAAVLAPLAELAAKAGADGDKSSDSGGGILCPAGLRCHGQTVCYWLYEGHSGVY